MRYAQRHPYIDIAGKEFTGRGNNFDSSKFCIKKNMRNHKSLGSDGFTAEFFKCFFFVVVVIFCFCFCYSWVPLLLSQ